MYGKHGKCQSFTEICTPPVFWYANVSFTIFTIYLLFGSYIIAHICEIFVRCKLYFVQIHFLVQWNLLRHMYLFTCF